ncbi:MAG TPA: hypothetical protein VND91_09325, partial [Candidatus Saccharimonadia bacterium]|nr:hypothetical protein [Candidatus Saccharimonadia bacterium]
LLLAAATASAVPPYSGTITLDPDIITSADPTAYTGLTATGRGVRTMFDRRRNAFVQYDAYLFRATYADALQIEFQVNPEFGSVEAAQAQVAFYAPIIGRLPRMLRRDVQTSWIHQGDQPFGGGNNNLLIHTGSLAQQYIAANILEETLAHEAAHTSLDAQHAASAGWLDAQARDPEFISTYARDNATREDVAETIVPWLALRARAGRVAPATLTTIRNAIPRRIAYLDAQALDLAPWGAAQATTFAIGEGVQGSWSNPAHNGQGFFFDVSPSIGNFFGVAWFTWTTTPGQYDWLTGAGTYSGTRATITLHRTTGGRFADATPVTTAPVGSATIEFTSCTQARIDYVLNGASGSIPIQRLLPPGSLCAASNAASVESDGVH